MYLCAFPYPSHNTDGLSRQKAWIAYFIVHNAVKHLLFIIPWKRGLDTNTDRPKTGQYI